MTSLPDVLTSTDLSLAELHAAKLDGAVLPLGDGFRSIDRPDGRRDRIAALAPRLPARVIATEETAAWIWGALAEAPEPLRLSMQPRRRARLARTPLMVVREVRIDLADIVTFATDQGDELAVTHPLRTAIDLAFTGARASASAALHGLLDTGLVEADEVRSAVVAGSRKVGRAAAVAAIDRVDVRRDSRGHPAGARPGSR